jgi:hypothetical protein
MRLIGAIALIIATASPNMSHSQDNAIPANWESGVNLDSFTGKKTALAVVSSRNTKMHPHRRNENIGEKARLVFLCSSGKMRFYASIESQLIAGHAPSIMYRFDDLPPVKGVGMTSSESSDAIGMWGDKASASFMSKLEAHQTVRFRIEDRSFGQTDMSFNVAGAKLAFAKLRENCRA